MNEKQDLVNAIKYLKFIKILDIPTSTLNDWLNKTFKIPFQFAIAIEALTKGHVKVQQGKSYRLASIGLMVLLCDDVNILFTFALETLYQNTLHISASECIALLESGERLKIYFDISTKKVHQYA
jgi:hypothetical protein